MSPVCPFPGVGVLVDVAGGFDGEGVGVVEAGEFDESCGGDGPFEVEMEFGFGQAAEPEFGVGWGERRLRGCAASHLVSLRRMARLGALAPLAVATTAAVAVWRGAGLID